MAMRGPLWGQEGTQVHLCDPVPQPQGMGEGRGRETGEGAGTATGEGERGSCSQDTRDSEGGDRTVSGPNTVRAAASHRGRTWQGRGGGRAGREDPVPLSGAAAPHHARPPPGIGLGGPAAGPVGLLTLTAALLRPPTPEPQGGPSPLHLGAPPTPGFRALAGASPGLLPDPGRADPGTGHGVEAGAARWGLTSRGALRSLS